MLGSNELAATSSSGGGFNPSTLILIVIVVLAFYLLMIRPQQRRRQQAAQKQDSVQPGARVRTTAGMYATVVAVDGDDVILEVAPGVESRFMKRAVMDVISPGEAPEEDLAEDAAPADEADTEYAADDDEPAGEEPADTPLNGSSEPSDEESEEAAYEQATGTKKD